MYAFSTVLWLLPPGDPVKMPHKRGQWVISSLLLVCWWSKKVVTVNMTLYLLHYQYPSGKVMHRAGVSLSPPLISVLLGIY